MKQKPTSYSRNRSISFLARAVTQRRSLFIALLFVAVTVPISVHAATSISQAFTSEEQLPLGAIVSLKNNAADLVSPTYTDNLGSIYGVVVNDTSSPIILSNGAENEVHVATSGVTSVLVSDINGKISQGDHITASPIKGVGMKATNNVKTIGVAQGEPRLTSSSKQEYTDENGKKHPVTLGEVSLLVNVGYFYKTPEKTLIPGAIQNMANALAGKSVDPLPIIISAAIFIITLVVVASIIYSMIRSSIISVGRNPMSQSAIYRDVIQLSALVLGILTVAVVTIYLILTRF